MKLYRVEFKPGAVFAMGENANHAKAEAADYVGATIRQATHEEMLTWIQAELDKMKETLTGIDNSLNDQIKTKDCE